MRPMALISPGEKSVAYSTLPYFPGITHDLWVLPVCFVSMATVQGYTMENDTDITRREELNDRETEEIASVLEGARAIYQLAI